MEKNKEHCTPGFELVELDSLKNEIEINDAMPRQINENDVELPITYDDIETQLGVDLALFSH